MTNKKTNSIPTKVEDLATIDLYFKDSNMIDGFWVAQNYIATFQDGEQIAYDDFFSMERSTSTKLFEECCVMGALNKLADHKKHTQLVKISSFTYYFERYENKEQKLFKEFAQRQQGKWYFQPDQRGEIEQEILETHWHVFGIPTCRDTVPVQEMVFA
tara:strand:+ start:158 stop:631 length:474 start_codon:yes stop_codon:yes gene_type:complete